MKTLKSLMLLLVISLSVSACSTTEANQAGLPEKIVYAGMPLDGTTEVADSFGLMVQVIEEELGIDVELQEAASAPAIIEALSSGTAQFGNLHGFGYVVGKEKYSELQLIATPQRRPDQAPGIYAYGIVSKDNAGILTLEDIKGSRVCYGAPTGLTTFMAPAAAMARLGIDGNPETSKDVIGTFVGDGVNAAYGILNGDCDVAFIADSTFDFTLDQTGDMKKEDFRIIWESETLPSSALVFGPSFPESLKEKVKSLFLEKLNKTWLVENGWCTDEASCLFLNKGNWGWTKTDDSFYDVVRDMCNYVESENCRQEN